MLPDYRRIRLPSQRTRGMPHATLFLYGTHDMSTAPVSYTHLDVYKRQRHASQALATVRFHSGGRSVRPGRKVAIKGLSGVQNAILPGLAGPIAIGTVWALLGNAGGAETSLAVPALALSLIHI